MPADTCPVPSTLLRLLALPSGTMAVDALSAATTRLREIGEELIRATGSPPESVVEGVRGMRADLEALRLEHEAWGVQLTAARRDRDAARKERDEFKARLDALTAPVEGVDVEEVLRRAKWFAPGVIDWDDLSTAEWSAAIDQIAAAPALAREVVRLRAALATAEQERDEARLRADAFDVYRDLVTRAAGLDPKSCADDVAEAIIALHAELSAAQSALSAMEQERDAARAQVSAAVKAYQDSTGNQTSAEQLPADIADLAQHEGQLAADCDMYEEFMHDLLVAIGADPTAWDALDEQAKAVEHARALVAERDELRATLAAERGEQAGAPSYTACVGDGCGDEDLSDIDQRTGLCGMCRRAADKAGGAA